jgi:flagellar hook-associated protein 2
MSSPITLSGFNNIDFSSVLNALMSQERIPVTQLTQQQTALTNQKTFFTTFATKLASLESAVASLTAASAFDGRSATVSDPTAAKIQVGSTTPRGSYSIAVSSLAKAQVTGTDSVHADRNTTIVASAGTLTIGGVAVTLTGDVTLDGLADAINTTANIGVSASVVQNGNTFQLALTGQQTGAANTFAITNGLSGGTGGVTFSATNAQDASNAVGTVNGIAFSTPTNTVDGVVPQSTLELIKTATPTNPIVLTITGDRSSIKELVNKLKGAYNDVVAFIDDQALAAKEKNPGSIGRDPLVRDLRSQLARVLNTERTVTGVFTAISQVGLGFTRTGQLEFNEAAFDSALDRDPAGVQNLFRGTGGVGGAFSELATTIAGYTSAGGFIPMAQTRLTTQVSRIGERLIDMERRLAARRETLQREFTAADLAIKQLNNSLGQLTSLGGS